MILVGGFPCQDYSVATVQAQGMKVQMAYSELKRFYVKDQNKFY